MKKLLYAVVTGLTALACASVQPAKIEAGDRCLRCRRPIGDLKLAGEVVDRMRAPFPFRTAGCLAKYVKANSDVQFTAIFVTDYTSGRMLAASDAWFVPANIAPPDSKAPENDYYAFRSRTDAESFKAGGTAPLRWPQVVAAAN
jgi:hypothetical protein